VKTGKDDLCVSEDPVSSVTRIIDVASAESMRETSFLFLNEVAPRDKISSLAQS
jgi:hypothetical protein